MRPSPHSHSSYLRSNEPLNSPTVCCADEDALPVPFVDEVVIANCRTESAIASDI